jgi:ketosteroid isomerase-like protein
MSRNPRENVHLRVRDVSASGNIGELMSLFADDAVVMPPNESTLFGKEEIQGWWEDYFQNFGVRSSIDTEREITDADDQLFETGGLSVEIVPKQRGAVIRDDIRSLIVWKRDASGAWKISQMMWNSIKPVGSGTNRYMTRMLQKKSAR